jgi:hypothetical protein
VYRVAVRVLVAAVGGGEDVEPFTTLAGALAGRGHAVDLALDAGHHAGAPAQAGVTRVRLGDLSARAIDSIAATALDAPSPADRTLVARANFLNRREADLRIRLEQLAPPHDRVVVAETLLFRRDQEVRWPTPTTVIVTTPVARQDLVALEHVVCNRLAGLSPVFLDAGDRITASWRFIGFLRAAGTGLAPEVEAFLAAGPPPVFFAMGPTRGRHAALCEAGLAAARRLGLRAIVQQPLAPAAAPDVLVVGEIDRATLFPRCAAVLTHGGTTTVVHALHAGRPVAFLPLTDHEMAWAKILAARGTGTGHVDPRLADSEGIHAMLRRAVEDTAVSQAAAALAGRLRDEDALRAACEAIEA